MPRSQSRSRYAVRPRPEKAERPFATVAEAWFWAARALAARADGARFEATASAFARPCEPDDVIRVALDLARARRLGPLEIRALAEFGARAAPPDARLAEHAWALAPWDGAHRPPARRWWCSSMAGPGSGAGS